MPMRKGPTKSAGPPINRRPEPRDLSTGNRRVARLAATFKDQGSLRRPPYLKADVRNGWKAVISVLRKGAGSVEPFLLA